MEKIENNSLQAEKMAYSDKLSSILNKVEKPARYTGGEYGQIVKNKDDVQVRVALCFPDTYEIGMSNLGMRIIYGVLNNIDGVWCERVFAPWPDMKEQMQNAGIALYGLESGDPIGGFDIIAFSLGYELSYTNVLGMLDLAGVHCRSTDRPDDTPLVIAGGTCCFNPEPMADFVDLFVIGEGEEVIVELINLYMINCTKHEFLKNATKLEGVYIPSLYNSVLLESTLQPNNSQLLPSPYIKKRIVKDLDNAYFPINTIVPSMGIVHDRAVLELFRGCKRGCKFCQAGHTYVPLRMRSPEVLIGQGKEAITNSGYDEIALLSLSTSDYPHLGELCDGLLDWCEPRRVNLSLPSLRADNFSVELMHRVQKVRKSGLTFAPEAGTQRLRDYINKKITEEDLLNACSAAFAGGWNNIKLYFMLGLPTETDEDVVGIAELAQKVLGVWKVSTNNEKRGVRITVSTSCFIPKPHTPFERETQISIDEYLRRVQMLKANIRSKKIQYNWHSPEQGYVEAALSRGDRRLGKVVETAYASGARFDSWSEHFSLETWLEAFDKCGLNPEDYASRQRTEDEVLPWGFIWTK